jgi:hypothetical protein
LSIIYRPCIPVEKTKFTKENKCLVKDIQNRKELDLKLKEAKAYVGEALFTLFINR